MESIYYVQSWLCHRSCAHCYEERFHPYHGEELRKVVDQAQANAPRIIDAFPESMKYLDPEDGFREKPGRVILAGGEILLDAVRESVLYPSIRRLKERYPYLRVVVQTTGDTLREQMIEQLLSLGVWLISVSGMDAFHEGFELAETRERQMEKLSAWFEKCGMRMGTDKIWQDESAAGPYFHFFGATPESWIGKLWPRGRAFENELSQATVADNFCNQWSGGLNFLATRHRGSEVSVDPEGNVFPCCLKTKKPLGNLLEVPMDILLGELNGNPIYEAISMGHPERMGIRHGWSVEKFYEKSRVTLPSGHVYQNLCVGCDRFHDEVMASPALVSIQS